MKEPIWLNAADIYGIHKEVIRVSGSRAGILDAGKLTSSLNKAKNVFHYAGNADLFYLAAVYGYGLTKNHCFLDGNTQLALIAVYTFLAMNGLDLIASEEDAVTQFSAIAQSQASQSIDIDKLSRWLQTNTQALNLFEES